MNNKFSQLFCTSFILFFIYNTLSFAQLPDWAVKAGGSGNDNGNGIATDINGNSYITGFFFGTATFGTIQLISSGAADIFIAKYDTSGNCIWAVKAGGNDADENGIGISIDANGNSYITGRFSGTAIFGTIQLVSSGSADIFIAKYDTSGNCVWAVKAGGNSDDFGNGIAIDVNGNSYITGLFIGTATFGTIQLVSNGVIDIFIAKYDTSGNCIWAQKAGGSSNDIGNDISSDANGNNYITGVFTGTATFGTIQLVSSGAADIFIAKYDTSGNCVWAVKAGGNYDEDGIGISTDANRNNYITGVFSGTATFGSIQLVSSGSADIFIAKYDTSGNCIWAVRAGGSDYDYGKDIFSDANGNNYITGIFNGTATFGSIQLVSSGSADIFIAKYDTNGNCIWALKAGGSSPDAGSSISTDANGNSYVTGYFTGTATFGSIQLVSSGSEDIFIAKLIATQITIFSPNGGEIWEVGTIEDIRWLSTSISDVKIEYSTNNGTTWTLIIESVPANAGIFSWMIPNTPSNQCKVRISDVSNPSVYSTSASTFTINTRITLLAPVGGEIWEVGTIEDIRWSSVGISDVQIEYSTDNGNSWTTIISSIPSITGTYSWLIPNNTSNQCRVRISDVSNPSDYYISLSTFTIYAPNDIVNYNRIEFYTNVGTPTSNPNNYINPGRLIRLRLKINNGLTTNILTGYGTIRSITPGVIVTDSIGTFNNVLSGQSGWSVDDYEIDVSSYIPLGSQIDLLLIVTQALTPTGPWKSVFSFPIASLRVSQILLDDDQYPDSWGNNNQIPEPSETIEVIPLLNNISSQSIYSANGRLATSLDGVTVWNNVTGASGLVFDTWRYNVVSGVPQPIDAGATGVQPELDYVFNYANILPYQSLPFGLYYNAYLEGDPDTSWQTGGILIKWENEFNMQNGIISTTDEIVNNNLIPTKIELHQNFPNPFNSSSIIKYSIPKSSQVTLKIFNTLGEELETIINEEKAVGIYEVNWNATNLPSGVYFYQLKTGSYFQTRKMILLK